MKKKPTPAEIELAAEDELARLQRQYRTMENQRTQFFAGGSSKAQARVIEILKDERDDLDLTLSVAKSDANLRKDIKINSHLASLLAIHDQFVVNINAERTQILELEEQIKTVDKKMQEMAKHQVTDEQANAKTVRNMKLVSRLENNLDTEVKKFNTVMADNAKLRLEIEHMLKERAKFNNIWNHLIRNLNKGKRFMLDLIEQSTLAYDQREELCQKLTALKVRGATDLAQHTAEMRVLQRKLDNDAKLQTYLSLKGQRRVLVDLEAREEAKRAEARAAKEKQLIYYKDMLRKITEFTGEEDIESLALQFKKQEADNFSMFKYVTELNMEVDGLVDNVTSIRWNIDQQKEKTAWRKDHEAQKLIDIQAELDDCIRKTNAKEEKVNASKKKLEHLLKGIDEMFRLIRADDTPILNLLGDTVELTTNNVMLYLEIIENRTNEIMDLVFFDENADESQKLAALTEVRPDEDSEEELPQGEELELLVVDGMSAEPVTDEPKEEEEAAEYGEDEGDPELKKAIREDPKPKLKPIPLEKLVASQPCPLCVEVEEVTPLVIAETAIPLNRSEVRAKLALRLEQPDIDVVLHNVSMCKMPRSRKIMQRRYQ